MSSAAPYLNPSEAASRLGVSAKALRLYEQRGLVSPNRTAAGWRVYGPEEIAKAAEIVTLRALGLSLSQVARVLTGNVEGLEPALADHEHALQERMRQLARTIDTVRTMRADIAQGHMPAQEHLALLLEPRAELGVAFDLPWPWGGERFELRAIKRLNYIIGPLGSGKTRLAKRLAEALPGAIFLGLERATDAVSLARIEAEPVLRARVGQIMTWLLEDRATVSDALLALVAGLQADASVIVVDMVEQSLDQATQEAVIAWLRRRGADGPPLFLMTRSSAILDLAAVSADETIILCPANHSPPTRVAAYPGAPGYEAVATCLATPEVRARTEGVIAMRPQTA